MVNKESMKKINTIILYIIGAGWFVLVGWYLLNSDIDTASEKCDKYADRMASEYISYGKYYDVYYYDCIERLTTDPRR